MSVKFANNAFGTLNAGINNSATSITLSSGQGARFPTLVSGEYFYATLIDTSNNLEIVKCTARSTDVLTVTRAQESTTAQAFAIGDRIELRVTAAGLTDAANPYDKDTSSTGSFALPSGTTAQQPTAADSEGHIRYDSDDNVVYYSDGTNWLKVSSTIATLSSVTGNIFDGVASTLTLAGKGFQSANLVVNFTQSSDSIDEDVTVTPTSDTAATVTVPAAVYNNVTAGNVVSITATNEDGVTSVAVTKTALALPSGGTVTTSGSYRVHTFTSSGTFTNTVASLSVEYLVVAGGAGGGAGWRGGGGGAGGYRSSVSGESSGGGASAETALTLSTGNKTVTIGAGGTGTSAEGNNGDNSVFDTVTSLGGGGGGGPGNTNDPGLSGGSGGGGNSVWTGGSLSTGGAGTTGQGFAGGTGTGPNDPVPQCGGGGGGAGAVGNVAGSGATDGDGGIGVSSSITGSAVHRAGGGSGGNYGTGNTTVGGTGGGGTGSRYVSSAIVGGNGTANTGGGGGGAGGQSGTAGGQGGSGVVIIRYQL